MYIQKVIHLYTRYYVPGMYKKEEILSAILYIFGLIVTPFPFEIFIGVNVRLLGLKPVQMK